VNAQAATLRKQALVERASLARLHLRHEVRGLRASVQRGARVVGWVRRVVIAAQLGLAVAGLVRARVRKRTDMPSRKPHARPSTGEIK
jgi:hypothetical protein